MEDEDELGRLDRSCPRRRSSLLLASQCEDEEEEEADEAEVVLLDHFLCLRRPRQSLVLFLGRLRSTRNSVFWEMASGKCSVFLVRHRMPSCVIMDLKNFPLFPRPARAAHIGNQTLFLSPGLQELDSTGDDFRVCFHIPYSLGSAVDTRTCVSPGQNFGVFYVKVDFGSEFFSRRVHGGSSR